MPTPVMPPPANYTITVPTTTTTTPATLPPPNMLPVFNIIGGTVAVIGVVLVLFILVIKRMGPKRPSAVRLNKSLTDPAVDAIGVLLDIDSNKAIITPLKRVENTYITYDPTLPTALVVSNPFATRFNIEGKPLVIAPMSGKAALEQDTLTITALGLARLAVAEDASSWDDTLTPDKAFRKIVTKLSTTMGKLSGKIKLTPKLYLGFEMSAPRVVMALMSQKLNDINAILTQTVEVNKAVDQLAEALKLKKQERLATTGSVVAKILLVSGIVIFIVLLGWFLLKSLGG